MSLWSALSVLAILAAAAPPLYFVAAMRTSRRAFAVLAALLGAALLVHGGFHLAQVLEAPPGTVGILEAASAALVLLFALTYWPLRRRR